MYQFGKEYPDFFDSILFHGHGSRIDSQICSEEQGGKWRVTFEGSSQSNRLTVLSMACRTWEQMDELRYASLPSNEFNFEITKKRVTQVTIPGLQAKLVKV